MPGGGSLYNATAARLLEVISPEDEAWKKLAFYGSHHVGELLIAEIDERTIHWLSLDNGAYEPADRSSIIQLTVEQLAAEIDWP